MTDFSTLWDHAGDSAERDAANRAMHHAVAQVTPVSEFLFQASDEHDLENRIALAGDRFTTAAAQHGVDEEELINRFRNEASLLLEARRVTGSAACDNCGKSGKPYTYRGKKFNGLVKSRGAELCPDCAGKELDGFQSDKVTPIVDGGKYGSRKQAGGRYVPGPTNSEGGNPPEWQRPPQGTSLPIPDRFGYIEHHVPSETPRGASSPDAGEVHILDAQRSTNGKHRVMVTDSEGGSQWPMRHKDGGLVFDNPESIVTPRHIIHDALDRAEELDRTRGTRSFEGSRKRPIDHLAALKQALEEGQNPLEWLPAEDGGEGQAEDPSISGNEAFLEGDYVGGSNQQSTASRKAARSLQAGDVISARATFHGEPLRREAVVAQVAQDVIEPGWVRINTQDGRVLRTPKIASVVLDPKA